MRWWQALAVYCTPHDSGEWYHAAGYGYGSVREGCGRACTAYCKKALRRLCYSVPKATALSRNT